MNRRQFITGVAGGALAAAVLPKIPSVFGAHDASRAAAPKLSVMLWTVFRNLPFEQRLENVAAAGYSAVELVDEFKHWSESDFARANTRKRAVGITFDCTAGLEKGIANPADRPAFLDEVKLMLPIMQKLEIPALIVLSGDRTAALSSRAQHDSCVEGLKRAADLAASANIMLLLENIDPEENPNYYLTSCREGFQIVRQVNHPHVRFLYDLYHEQIAEGNLIETLEKNFDHLGLVHVADVPGRHAPGTGEINYRNIFRKLAQLKYDRYIAMEFLPQGDPITELRQAREFALSSWQS